MVHIRRNQGWQLPESEATDEALYWNRRKFLKVLGSGAVGGALLASDLAAGKPFAGLEGDPGRSGRSVLTLPESATSHNFAEFSYWNAEVPRLAQALDTASWPVSIGGLVERPLVLEAGELSSMMSLEQRVYRFRCVEGWAMIVPWTGFPLKKLLKLVQPTSSARYVRFESFSMPEIAPSQRSDDWHAWPYTEALRIDEAANDLAFMATGIYGAELPKEQGAPLRLVVPWKHAVKSVKAVTRIELVASRPATFWSITRPSVSNFDCNVDPADESWGLSQKREILAGAEGWQPTRSFNGYAESVSYLYT